MARLRFVSGVNQPPPISMTPIASESDPKTSSSADGIGNISLFDFMNPRNELEHFNFTFHNTDVVRKKGEFF